jgi:hypothetical protein
MIPASRGCWVMNSERRVNTACIRAGALTHCKGDQSPHGRPEPECRHPSRSWGQWPVRAEARRGVPELALKVSFADGPKGCAKMLRFRRLWFCGPVLQGSTPAGRFFGLAALVGGTFASRGVFCGSSAVPVRPEPPIRWLSSKRCDATGPGGFADFRGEYDGSHQGHAVNGCGASFRRVPSGGWVDGGSLVAAIGRKTGNSNTDPGFGGSRCSDRRTMDRSGDPDCQPACFKSADFRRWATLFRCPNRTGLSRQLRPE